MPNYGRLKQIAGGIVDTSTSHKLDELDKFAKQEPDNPAPLLMSAMVATVTQREPPSVDKYMSEARNRLKKANPAAKETEFEQALHDVIQPELVLYDLARSPGAPDRKNKAKNSASQSAKANARLDKAAKALNDDFVDVTVAAVHSLSWGNSIKGAHYQQGVKRLEKAAAAGDNQDYASFFLIYAHRRVRDYGAALKVAEGLEKRNPNSALAKKILGGIHTFAGNADMAIDLYRQATILAPNDPSAYHGLTQAYLAAAKAADEMAGKHDRSGHFRNLRAKLPF